MSNLVGVMDEFIIQVKYHGEFNAENKFENFEIDGIVFSASSNFEDLVQLLSNVLKIDNNIFDLDIRYEFQDGSEPMRVYDDRSLNFYLRLKKTCTDFKTYPLCIQQIYKGNYQKIQSMFSMQLHIICENLVNNTYATPFKTCNRFWIVKPISNLC